MIGNRLIQAVKLTADSRKFVRNTGARISAKVNLLPEEKETFESLSKTTKKVDSNIITRSYNFIKETLMTIKSLKIKEETGKLDIRGLALDRLKKK